MGERDYKAVFFDISGVLYHGDESIPGAADAVNAVRDEGLTLRFLTNTSRKTAAQIVHDLATYGIETLPGEVITAPSAARDYLAQHELRPYCLVHPDIQSEFAELEQDYPNAVVIGDAADDLNYANLNQAFRLCLGGAVLVGIGANRFFRQGSELLLDAGPFVKAIEYAASVEAVTMGKPSREFFQGALDGAGCAGTEVLMVGDDVFGDVDGALHVGIDGCLVRTGKYQPDDEDKVAGEFACIDSVVALPALLGIDYRG
jgi:HAD superfamily hydrolase (TIGR01458 family)